MMVVEELEHGLLFWAKAVKVESGSSIDQLKWKVNLASHINRKVSNQFLNLAGLSDEPNIVVTFR